LNRSGGQGRAQQIVGSFGGGLLGGLPDPVHFADGLQSGPAMHVSQRVDIGGYAGRARFDTAMPGIDVRLCRVDLARRVIEQQHDVGMQGWLVLLQGEGIVTALIDDLLGDGALTVECVGSLPRRRPGVTIVPFKDSIANSFGTAVISLDFASVATCASTMRCSQPHVLTMCRGDLRLARSKDRRRTFPSIVTGAEPRGSVAFFVCPGSGEYDSLMTCHRPPIRLVCHVPTWTLWWWNCWPRWRI
jgi:hypothetical protein